MRLCVTHAGGAYQDQCFALVVGQSGECLSEFLKFDVTVLLGECLKDKADRIRGLLKS